MYMIFLNDYESTPRVTFKTIAECAEWLEMPASTARERLVNKKSDAYNYKKLDDRYKYGIEYYKEEA